MSMLVTRMQQRIPKRNNIQRSAVTPLIRQSVKTIHYAFFYLYPHLIQLEVDKNQLIVFKLNPWDWTIVPWLASTFIVTFSLGWGSCVYIVCFQLLGWEPKPWLKWNLFNTLIILGLGVAATAELITFVILSYSPQMFLAFTRLQELERQCIRNIRPEQSRAEDNRARMQTRDLLANEFRVTQQRSVMSLAQSSRNLPTKDTIGVLLNCMVILAGVIPFPFTVVGIATNLDPFYFVFEELLLPHPYYRELKTIVFVPVIRFFLGYLCIIDFLRVGVVFIVVLVVSVFGIVSITKKLKFVFYDQCLRLYVQLRLILASIETLMSGAAGGLIFVGQFATILLLWIVFKCLGLISIYIYAGVALLAIYFILLCAILLPAVARIRTVTKSLIRTKTDLHYTSNYRYARKYYYYNLWKSQQSIYVTCMHFFVIQKGVTMTYFKELVTNLVNAAILIDPKAL